MKDNFCQSQQKSIKMQESLTKKWRNQFIKRVNQKRPRKLSMSETLPDFSDYREFSDVS